MYFVVRKALSYWGVWEAYLDRAHAFAVIIHGEAHGHLAGEIGGRRGERQNVNDFQLKLHGAPRRRIPVEGMWYVAVLVLPHVLESGQYCRALEHKFVNTWISRVASHII